MREIYNMTDSPPGEHFVFNSPDSPDTLVPGTNSNSDSSQTVTPTNAQAATDFSLCAFGDSVAEPQAATSSQCMPKVLTFSQANELLKCFQTSCATSGTSTRLSLVNLLPSRLATLILLMYRWVE